MVAMLALSVAVASTLQQGVPQYETYPPRYLEPSMNPRTWEVEHVQDWMESIGFHEYRQAVLDAGIDGKRLLGLNEEKLRSELLLASSEHAAVLSMEVDELRARRGLMSNSELRKHQERHPPPELWGTDAVQNFLEDAGLQRYAAAFEAAGVDGSTLLSLRQEDLDRLLSGSPNPGEQNEAAAEVLIGLINHLRWRSQSHTSENANRDEL